MADKETADRQPNELRAAIKEKAAKYDTLKTSDKIVLLPFIKKDVEQERDELESALNSINAALDVQSPPPRNADNGRDEKKSKGKGTVNPDLKKPLLGLLSKDAQDPAGLTAKLKEQGVTAKKDDVAATLKELVAEKTAKKKGSRWFVKA